MVAEEPLNGGGDFEYTQEEAVGDVDEAPTEEVVTFGEEEGESEEVTGFMSPEERETSVDTGEEIQPKEEEEEHVAQIPIIVFEEVSGPATGEAEVAMEFMSNGVPSIEPPSLLVS